MCYIHGVHDPEWRENGLVMLREKDPDLAPHRG
jgi:hypothetical protein